MLLDLTSAVLAATMAASVPHPTAVVNNDSHQDVRLEVAKREFESGSAAYQMGRYEEAVQHFERSYELSHRSDLLFNLGQAYARWYEVSHDSEHLRRARRLFDNYVGVLEDQVEHDKRARVEAQRRLVEIDDELASIRRKEDARADQHKRKDKPVYKKGWFWGTIVGVLVVGAAATTVGVLVARKRRQPSDPELGTIGSSRLSPGAGVSIRF